MCLAGRDAVHVASLVCGPARPLCSCTAVLARDFVSVPFCVGCTAGKATYVSAYARAKPLLGPRSVTSSPKHTACLLRGYVLN